jgi:MFS family permease
VVGARDRSARTAVATAYAVQGLCFAGLLTQVPALQRRFAFTDGELSLVLLAVPVVAGIGSVLAGLLAPRLGSAAVLRAGGPLVCASIVGAGAVGSRGGLYAVLVAVGLGLGLVDASMNMQGVAVQRRYGRPLLASLHGVWSVGGIAGALATALTARLGWSTLASLTAVGALGLVASLAAGPLLLRPAEESAPADDVAVVIPWRPLVAVGVAMMLAFIADSAASNWSAVYLSRQLHATPAVAPLGLAAYQTCMVLGRAFADRLARRYGPVRSVAFGASVGAAGLALVAVADRAVLGVAGFALLGLGMCVVVPQSFSAAGRLDPTGSGVAVARVNLFNYAGFVVGAALVGVLAEGGGLRLAFAVPAALALGIVALAGSFGVRPELSRRGPG